MKVTAVLSILLAAADAASLLAERQNPAGTSKVNLASKTGPATFLGSGFIYGWPDNGSDADKSIPDYLAQDIKFQASRAGGAQTPSRGWAYGGQAQYAPRFRSTLSNYKTTRKFNGTFILMIHDLWGNDGSTTQQTLHPGDNNDWSGMENFLKQLVSDIKANNMLDGLVIDIWNEPELNIFWSRTWDQFLNYYSRATKYLRTQLPNTLISGPSAAHSPSTTRSTWDTWVSRIVKDNVVPDIYSWHQIGDWEREPARTLPDFDTLRNKYKAPVRPIDINEYASSAEQNPGTTAFFLSQCERYNMRCLRSNWGGGSNLHNWMGALVYKTGNTYFPNGEWQLYKYYANMVGTRVATTLSTDLIFDSFAVVNGKSVKIIAGTRLKQRAYQLSISGLTSIGLPAQGSVSVRTLRFDFSGAKTEITKPVDLGVKSMSYSGDTLSILQNPPTDSTAYAYEFSGV